MQKAASDRFYILDVLRALAVTLVILTHYFSQYFPGGSIGVSIFFVLSGYLVTNIILKPEISTKQFLIRRLSKIYPAYLTAIILQIVLAAAWGKNIGVYKDALPSLLLFFKMPNWIGMGIGVFWTLQIEVIFYFVVGVLFKRLESHRKILLVSAIFIGVSLLLKIGELFEFKIAKYSICRFLVWSDGLFYGSLLALYFKSKRRLAFKKWQAQSLVYASMIAIIVIALLGTGGGRFWPIESSLASILCAIILCVVTQTNTPNFLVVPAIQYLAIISYSLYLCHAIPLDYDLSMGIKGSNLAARIFLTVTFTLIMHYAIERPGVKLGRKAEKYVGQSE